jgi:hypothetical protein
MGTTVCVIADGEAPMSRAMPEVIQAVSEPDFLLQGLEPLPDDVLREGAAVLPAEYLSFAELRLDDLRREVQTTAQTKAVPTKFGTIR